MSELKSQDVDLSLLNGESGYAAHIPCPCGCGVVFVVDLFCFRHKPGTLTITTGATKP